MKKLFYGKEGQLRTWQAPFPETTKCVKCKRKAHIALTYIEPSNSKTDICRQKPKLGGRKLWLHDCCAIAIYFCENCLNPTALYNQG